MSRVIAFDIDGTLEKPEVKRAYRRLQERSGVTQGIVTARSEERMEEFIEEESLQVEFSNPGHFKVGSLRDVKDRFEADKFIYVGNTLRDMFASDFAGWRFKHARNAEDL